jgi:hypothetical protein
MLTLSMPTMMMRPTTLVSAVGWATRNGVFSPRNRSPGVGPTVPSDLAA